MPIYIRIEGADTNKKPLEHLPQRPAFGKLSARPGNGIPVPVYCEESRLSSNLYLSDVQARFREYKDLAEKALAQVDDSAFFRSLDRDANSLALLVKHMAGNLRSRWTDFLTSDGEKPDRRRDDEFVIHEGDSRAALMKRWEEGWAILFKTLGSLQPDDLAKTVVIRTQPLVVVSAINRQYAHAAYHVGQIIILARHWAGDRWNYLSVPPGQSDAYNRRMGLQYPEPSK